MQSFGSSNLEDVFFRLSETQENAMVHSNKRQVDCIGETSNNSSFGEFSLSTLSTNRGEADERPAEVKNIE